MINNADHGHKANNSDHANAPGVKDAKLADTKAPSTLPEPKLGNKPSPDTDPAGPKKP
jgi:hypothetical protein